MSSEIAVRDTDSWAPMLPAINQLSKGISNTEFVPKALRGKEYAVAACILTGRELGLGPMEALQKIHVVEGRPALSAELMRALVLRAGHEIRYPMMTDAKVTAEGRRAGSESWTSVTWTMAEAQRIGLTRKDNWRNYPRAMLAARATSELCRLLFPDALGGVSYTPDEIEEESAGPPTVTVTRAGAARSTVRRAKPPEPVEPPLDDGPVTGPGPAVDEATGEILDAEVVEDGPPPPGDAGTPDGVTTAQTRKLAALMRELAITDRAHALAYCGDVIGRDITSRSELTRAEASHVIDALQADRDAADASATLGLEQDAGPG